MEALVEKLCHRFSGVTGASSTLLSFCSTADEVLS